jgi:hypothetical protein
MRGRDIQQRSGRDPDAAIIEEDSPQKHKEEHRRHKYYLCFLCSFWLCCKNSNGDVFAGILDM